MTVFECPAVLEDISNGLVTITVPDCYSWFEFSVCEVVPSPDEVPWYSGEPCEWVSVVCDDGGQVDVILRAPRQEREPLAPEVVAKLRAVVADRWGLVVDDAWT